jgi:hypothetical protein
MEDAPGKPVTEGRGRGAAKYLAERFWRVTGVVMSGGVVTGWTAAAMPCEDGAQEVPEQVREQLPVNGNEQPRLPGEETTLS